MRRVVTPLTALTEASGRDGSSASSASTPSATPPATPPRAAAGGTADGARRGAAPLQRGIIALVAAALICMALLALSSDNGGITASVDRGAAEASVRRAPDGGSRGSAAVAARARSDVRASSHDESDGSESFDEMNGEFAAAPRAAMHVAFSVCGGAGGGGALPAASGVAGGGAGAGEGLLALKSLILARARASSAAAGGPRPLHVYIVTDAFPPTSIFDASPLDADVGAALAADPSIALHLLPLDEVLRAAFESEGGAVPPLDAASACAAARFALPAHPLPRSLGAAALLSLDAGVVATSGCDLARLWDEDVSAMHASPGDGALPPFIGAASRAPAGGGGEAQCGGARGAAPHPTAGCLDSSVLLFNLEALFANDGALLVS
jgi:hypothetical protein